ncbi:9414_t:CDS:2 [Cetraspora pellucida]|uniref:9414_t:CDS:1 n=1 Tax=Cetraspora pellucida TaxID=1433469 RepID=A0A9N8VSV0_9GLOM|nr:9414_t:CDS:2 [Cetraspora pellucida]
MEESNHHILLILDNATLHITCALILNNVKILMLPKNVTSKIQPIDANIIASFKLHYHYMQLQCTIDYNEAVIFPYDENRVPIIPPSNEGIEDIEENLLVDPNNELQIDALGVHNSMPVEDLLNIEEEQEVYHQFTNENLIQAATKNKQEENKIVIPSLTREEQLRILHYALKLLMKGLIIVK